MDAKVPEFPVVRIFAFRVLYNFSLAGCVAAWSSGGLAQSVAGTESIGSVGSPSNATATVSPTSVADAFSKTQDEDSLGISLGTSLASGKFGGLSNSDISSTALGVRYATTALRLSASLPYMRIRSAGTIFSGIDSTPVLVSTSSPGVRRTQDGLGDLTLGFSYTVPVSRNGTELELSGRIKLPTASKESGLSSRRTDFSGGIQLTHQLGRFAPFGSVTYRIFGDPSGLDLRDGMAASAGSSFVVSSNFVALASYHYARAAYRLVRDSHELFAGASYLVPHSRLRVTGFATAGLSRGAAAASGGISAAVDFL